MPPAGVHVPERLYLKVQLSKARFSRRGCQSSHLLTPDLTQAPAALQACMEAGHSFPQGPSVEPKPASRQVPFMWFSNVPVNTVEEHREGELNKGTSLKDICCQWSRDPKVKMLRNPATGKPYGHAILAVRPCVTQPLQQPQSCMGVNPARGRLCEWAVLAVGPCMMQLLEGSCLKAKHC